MSDENTQSEGNEEENKESTMKKKEGINRVRKNKKQEGINKERNRRNQMANSQPNNRKKSNFLRNLAIGGGAIGSVGAWFILS